MARYFKTFICLFLFFFASCQEGGEAGDLFGQWRMNDSENNYISFSGSIARLRNLEVGEVFGNFQHIGDSLFIQCYSIKGLATDTFVVENSYNFQPFNNIRTKIEVLDSEQLILSKDGKKWSFYKY